MALVQVDPNLFHLDWDRLAEVMAAIVVLAFILERALALVFETKAFKTALGGRGFRPWIALLVAFGICKFWHIDAISILLVADETHFLGELVTAGTIAGGSKGAMKLMQDVLGVKPKEDDHGALPEGGKPAAEADK